MRKRLLAFLMVLCLCQMPQMVWAAEVTEKMPQGTETEKLTEAETVPESEKQTETEKNQSESEQTESNPMLYFRLMIRTFMGVWKKLIKMVMNQQWPMTRYRWCCLLWRKI